MSHVFLDGSERAISFASRTLSSRERNYSQIERVALALVYLIKKYLPLNQKIHDGNRPQTVDVNFWAKTRNPRLGSGKNAKVGMHTIRL